MGDRNPQEIIPLKTPSAVLAPADAAGVATRHGKIDFFHRTVVMGILNITPDSFYDGGRHGDAAQSVRDGVAMVEAGAEIIDVGGESSRPGSHPISAEEEITRVLPVVREMRRQVKVPISIDTYKAKVAQSALDAGADLVNDISALRFDPEMVSLVAREQVPVVLMHMQGTPRTMQADPRYRDVVAEVRDFLTARVADALSRGVPRQGVIIDPGIGFGKTSEHNLALLRGLAALTELGRPLLVGASRKAFIGKILGLTADERLEGSLAAAVAAVLHGANMLRVHDVRETVRAARIADAIRYERHGNEESGKPADKEIGR